MTRAEYLNSGGDREAAFRAYYGQFITPQIIARVGRLIGVDVIKHSRDKDGAFNDIPLSRWDAIPIPAGTNAMLRAKGDYLTAAGWVCIAKEAARQIREGAL